MVNLKNNKFSVFLISFCRENRVRISPHRAPHAWESKIPKPDQNPETGSSRSAHLSTTTPGWLDFF